MKSIVKLLKGIQEIKNKYDGVREKERFNVFSALHKERDEVNLHSRTISYLLSPTSGHGMDKIFARIFLHEILKITKQEFSLDSVEVFPNEFNKSEYREIDILLINKRTKQAIIIENKIDAKDSNHSNKDDGYNGQLERYYNTIKTGKTGTGKDANDIGDFKCDSVLVYYLTLDGHRPSKDSIGKSDIKYERIKYETEIKEWLSKCIQSVPQEDYKIKDFIQQYLNLVNKMVNSEKERLELKNEVASNLEVTKHLIDNFIHVKWHTVHEFWNALKEAIESKRFKNIQLYPGEKFTDTITSVTHKNRNINHGITFVDGSGNEVYISGINALSWGIVNQKKWSDFKSDELKNIVFSDFSTDNTYRLINVNNMKNAITKIVEEIIDAKNDNYSCLNSD